MSVSLVLLVFILFLLFICLILLVRLFLLKNQDHSARFDRINDQFNRLDNILREEFSRNSDEALKHARDNRVETVSSLKTFSDIISQSIHDHGKLQKDQLETFAAQLKNFQDQQATNDHRNREEQKTSLKSFEEKLAINIRDLAELQRQRLDSMILQLEKMRETIENSIRQLQDDNSKKLGEMRATVDEKLQSTLEKRLSESFTQVSERLEQVHKGLGEMQHLAVGVGDLKKVLTNVKTRGIMGEIQLGNILEQILTPEQYCRDIATKKETRENVEYAIRLPGKNNDTIVYLPIDSKFPIENYHALLDAYDKGDADMINTFSKALESCIKKFARDIRDKYIDPPFTTDFGIMFLPVEGLYAEVVRNTSLIETLQREYKIVITGPTTLAAMLNSLQIGFRTLVIEKRSGEVWKILGAVKTEFSRFGDVLKKAQEKITKAGEDIDELVGARTRKIQSKLKSIQEMPYNETKMIMDNETEAADETENSLP